MAIYLEKCSVFAKLDMFSGEDLYSDNLDLIDTNAVNSNFNFFGFDNQLIMTCSGSYFIL